MKDVEPQGPWYTMQERHPEKTGVYLTALTTWMGRKMVQTCYWSGSVWGTSFDVTHWAELVKHPEE